jgi:hypothetical protein
MIPANLLDQLREKDPALWEKIDRVHAMRYLRQVDDPQILEFLAGEEKQAIIQGCLQDAIRARGWHLYQIRNDDLPIRPCIADIFRQDDKNFVMECDTEAEALLQAYLAALEATK